MDNYIRIATESDLNDIVSIYNEYINTTVTMDAEITTIISRLPWFNAHGPNHPILCYVKNDIIVGWVSLSKWSDRIGYAKTIEISVYVTRRSHHLGIGKILLQEAINRAKELKFHCIIARIDSTNQISLSLHKKYGFELVGVMKEIGFKFDKYVDVHVLQLLLN